MRGASPVRRGAQRLGRVSVCILLATFMWAGWPAGPARAADEPAWAEALRLGREALARGDSVVGRAQYIRADSIVGGHPNLVVRLAAMAARRGDRAEALRWLGGFAAMELPRALEQDTSFASLKGDPAFAAILDTIRARVAPVTRSSLVATLGDASLLAEDVAWDAPRHRWLASSIHRRKVVAVDAHGRVTGVIAPGAEGAWGIYALRCAADGRTLWATTAAGPTCEGYVDADSGRTALIAWDLESGRLIRRVELPRDGARHVLGDMTLAPVGTVYVTESLGGGAYRLAPGGTMLDTLAASGTFGSPQTPVLAVDGRRLLIADYPRGLASLDLVSHDITWLEKPRSLASLGIDGLYRATGHRLIAIQNGPPLKRLLELQLDAAESRIERWRVLEQGSEGLGEPNHGVVMGEEFVFIGNSGWDRVDEREALQTTADSSPPTLRKLSLTR